MASILVVAASLLSLIAVILAAAALFLAKNRLASKQQIKQLRRDFEQVKTVEDEVLEEGVSYEEFEKDIDDLAERLFHLVRSKYDFEAKTYQETIDKLEEMNVEDEKTKQSLIDFFNYLIELDYAEGGLSAEDRAVLRQAAYNLIRKTGHGLEEQG